MFFYFFNCFTDTLSDLYLNVPKITLNLSRSVVNLFFTPLVYKVCPIAL